MPVQWEHKLTASQRLRIDDAERKFDEALDAHEKMREIFDLGEWTSLGPERDGPTKAEEIKKLERDIKQFAIDTLRVLADAAWSIGSVERFRARIETDASDTLAWALAKVNTDDSPLLDTAALETALSNELSKWVVKAQRESPPPWRAMATTPAPSQAPDAAAPEIIKAQESKGHVEAAVAPNVLPTPAGPLELPQKCSYWIAFNRTLI